MRNCEQNLYMRKSMFVFMLTKTSTYFGKITYVSQKLISALFLLIKPGAADGSSYIFNNKVLA